MIMRLTALAAVMVATAAQSKDFDVHLLNQGRSGSMVFEPSFLTIRSGDTVHFIPVDKGHDVETIPGMAPDGAAIVKGEFSKPLAVTFTSPGIYGFRCGPHFAMGMIAAIAVGNPRSNLALAKTVPLPPMAERRMAPLLDALAAGRAAEPSASH